MDLRTIFRIFQNVSDLRRHERWTRPQLIAYQNKGLEQLRKHAYTHSHFYQRFHRGLFDHPLQDLPVLTKSMMMENFDELVTDRSIRLEELQAFFEDRMEGRLFLDRYWVNATSGSSGHPGFFLFNSQEWSTIVASFARGQEWSGAKVSMLQRRKMATVASTSPWHMSSQVARTAESWWTPSIRLPSTDSLENIVQELNHWQPDVLIAYASMARILANEQLSGHLHIQPKQTFTSSEVLTDETRRLIKTAWGDEPFDQYGATETADIAAEYQACRHLHLFEDLVIAESVDENYQHLPVGTYGAKILVTTLFSRTQPLIRYELNDSVRLSMESCSSGLPFAILESVQGRVEETLYLPAKLVGLVAIQPLVFNRIMDILPVSGWQVLQNADDSLTVLLSGARGDVKTAELESTLAKALLKQGAQLPSVKVQRVSTIPKTAGGKTPLVKGYQSLRK